MYQSSPYMIFMLPKGEAYSRHFVHPVVRPSVRYLGRQITLKLLLGYIYRWQWGEGYKPVQVISNDIHDTQTADKQTTCSEPTDWLGFERSPFLSHRCRTKWKVVSIYNLMVLLSIKRHRTLSSASHNDEKCDTGLWK